MACRIVQIKGEDVSGLVKPLVDGCAYNEFRRYRVITKKEQNDHLFRNISDLAEDGDSRIFAYMHGRKISGFALLRRLPWDSKILGKEMRQVAYLMAEGDYSESADIKASLLGAILKYTKGLNGLHLSCKVDTADITGIHALERAGFRLMDTVVTWRFEPSMSVPRLKNIYRVRDAENGDVQELEKLARRKFLMNRFYIDPSISPKRADKLYAEWIKNYCAAQADGIARVMVAESHSGIAGFLGYRFNKGIERVSGYKIVGQGLMAVSGSAKGAAISLVNSAIKDVISHYDFGEFDGLITNHDAMRVYRAFGFEIVRTKHTFHYNGIS